MRETQTIKFIKLQPHALVPQYGTAGAAAVDLHACWPLNVTANDPQTWYVHPGERLMVPTGLQVELPEGYGLFILPRSGYAKNHGVTVLNSPGTIDSDYRGELMVLVQNHGTDSLDITSGHRIAQAVLLPVPLMVWEQVDALAPPVSQRVGGFGSTGI